MGHDEETNNFNGGTTPVSPNPRATIGNNRLGMQKSRDFSAMDELNRISEAGKQEISGGEDIVLAPAEKAPKDKKVYIAIALGIITIAVFGIGFFINAQKSGSIFGGASAGTSDFTKWLLNGDGSVATTIDKAEKELTIADFSEDGENLIYPLNFYNVSSYATRKDENIEKYFSELNAKYTTLKQEKAGTNKASDVEKLGEVIELLENSVNYSKIKRDFVNEYTKGMDAAKSFYETKFKKKMSDEKYGTILNIQGRFYEDAAAEAGVYKNAGCYDDNFGINSECLMLQNNQELNSKATELEGEISRDFNKMASKGVLETLNKDIIKLVKSIGGK